MKTYKLLEGWQISYIKPCTAAATLGNSVETEKTLSSKELRNDKKIHWI